MNALNIIPMPVEKQRRKIPTLEECLLYADKLGLPEREALKFFHYYEGNGWVQGRGKAPIRKWQSAMVGWKLRWEDSGERRVASTPQAPLWQRIKALEGLIEAKKRALPGLPTRCLDPEGYDKALPDYNKAVAEIKDLRKQLEKLVQEQAGA